MDEKPLFKVTADDPLCKCGLQKHDHFAAGVHATQSAVDGHPCSGFVLDKVATDARIGAGAQQ